MVRTAIALWLASAVAAGFDASTILDAKLRSGAGGGFPCVVRGTITMLVGPAEFYLQDESSGVRVVSEPDQLQAGQLLEIEGWMYLADSGEFQLRAKQVSHLSDGAPLEPRPITLPDALAGGYQGQLVALRGSVLNVDFGEDFDTISLQSDRTSVRVFYPANRHGLSAFEPVYPGMEVAVTGISVPQTADPEFDGYQIRLRSPADLFIRQTPATGRPPPLEWAGSLATMLLVGAAAWIWTGRTRRTPSAPQVQ